MPSRLMTKQGTWLAAVLAVLVLGFTFAGAPRAQTQTTTTVAERNFEVLAVDGNHLILRDERGTSDYFVPADFVFTVDGKKMTVTDLKAGMKGKATVTTTTTVTPVVVTELRSGVVLATGFNSVTVLDRTDSVRKKFTQDQLNARGLQIFKEGKVIPVAQLNRGDEITATVISQRPPEVVTEREVEATLAQAPAKTEAPAMKAEPTAAKTDSPAVAATPAAPVVTQSTAPAPATTPAPAPAPAAASGLETGWYALIAVVIAAILFLVMRRRNDGNPSP